MPPAKKFVPTGKKGPRQKMPEAVKLGRLGGKTGGPARAESLTAQERSKIASLGGKAAAKKRIGINTGADPE